MTENFGYRELDHTADWALHVWAPDLDELFRQAAEGMFALMGVRTGEQLAGSREIAIEAPDDESLLVGFLTELLLVNEAERLVLTPLSVTIQSGRAAAECSVSPVVEQEKEIKAVTYHDLTIHRVESRLETVIVFDV